MTNCLRLRFWLILWLTASAVTGVLLWNDAYLDTRFFLATREFIQAYPVPAVWAFFKFFGEVWVVGVLLGSMFVLYQRRSHSWLKLTRDHVVQTAAALVAPSLAGGVNGLIAITLGRFRPLTEAANNWVLFRGFDVGAKNLAFPSGHATLAFAAAAVLVYFQPQVKWFAIFLAGGCAFSRVAHGAHFYSDVIVGSVLGWTIAWWGVHLIWRVSVRLSARG
ncbi:MAG: phosphatase PAP2 family protein [Phycisphaerales bacterium]|nr:phosphatase PAP2 family protein [Phycisphaerales bacterium]